VLSSGNELGDARGAPPTGSRHIAPPDPIGPAQPMELPLTSHGPQGPEAGGQSSGGSSGAPSTLLLMVAFAFVVAPCLGFFSKPSPVLRCAEAHALERPG
jgi:hypothetical protein